MPKSRGRKAVIVPRPRRRLASHVRTNLSLSLTSHSSLFLSLFLLYFSSFCFPPSFTYAVLFVGPHFRRSASRTSRQFSSCFRFRLNVIVFLSLRGCRELLASGSKTVVVCLLCVGYRFGFYVIIVIVYVVHF